MRRYHCNMDCCLIKPKSHTEDFKAITCTTIDNSRLGESDDKCMLKRICKCKTSRLFLLFYAIYLPLIQNHELTKKYETDANFAMNFLMLSAIASAPVKSVFDAFELLAKVIFFLMENKFKNSSTTSRIHGLVVLKEERSYECNHYFHIKC